MGRPTIDHLLDQQVKIWRSVLTKDALGVEKRGYTEIGIVDAHINVAVMNEANVGGGLAPTGGMRWYGRPDIDVQLRDVIEIVTGRDAGRTFEVNAPPVHPMDHHTQVDCIEWNGTL